MGQRIITQYAVGADASSPLKKWVYGSFIDEPVLMDRLVAGNPQDPWQELYYHRDRRFSVCALSDRTGSIQERYTYDPYGTTTIDEADGTTPRSLSAFDNPFRYTGRFHEDQLDLYYFRNRWYGPALDRFMNRDPLGYVDGMSVYRGYFAPHGADPDGLDYHHWFAQLGGAGQALIDNQCKKVKIDIDRYTTWYDGRPKGVKGGLYKDFPHGYIHHTLHYDDVYKFVVGGAPDCCTALLATWALSDIYHWLIQREKQNGGFHKEVTSNFSWSPFMGHIYTNRKPRTNTTMEMQEKIMKACGPDPKVKDILVRKNKIDKRIRENWKEIHRLRNPNCIPPKTQMFMMLMDAIAVASLVEDVMTLGVGVADDAITVVPAQAAKHAAKAEAKRRLKQEIKKRSQKLLLDLAI